MALVPITIDIDKVALREAYLQALTDLQTIQDAVDPTAAEIVWGMKKEAEILEKLLKVVKRMVT